MPRIVIPGLAEAIEAETLRRETAFLSLAEPIGGIEQLPLTFRHFFFLEVARSPFVCGGSPSAGDVALFLWVCSPQFSPDQKPLTRFRRWRFIRRCRRLSFLDTVDEIRRRMDNAMADQPASSGGRRAGNSPAGMLAMIVHNIASAYGWSEDTIINLPVARALQYVRLIQIQNDPSVPIINASDRVTSDFLKAANEASRKATATN